MVSSRGSNADISSLSSSLVGDLSEYHTLLVTVVFLAGANDHRHAAQVREMLFGAGQVI